MKHKIKYDRVQEILDQNPPLDEYNAYYRQFEVKHKLIGIALSTRELLQKCFSPTMHVVDVGCGRGDTLLNSAHLFRRGTGIDESVDVMLAMANEEKKRRGVANVDFTFGKGNALPFEDETIDLVFSERGPFGGTDTNLGEALRVLKPGGTIFLEIVGELTCWETRVAFDPDYRKPLSLSKCLDAERVRFLKYNIECRMLATNLQTMQFDDFYEWLRFQCYTWSWPDRGILETLREEQFQRLVELAADDEGHINLARHTSLICGIKKGKES